MLAGKSCSVAIAAIMLMLGGCTNAVVQDGSVADLPVQPATALTPTSVTIVIPKNVYATMPTATGESHTATEAQLGWVQDYALRLPAGDRESLDQRVNDCRFTAHDACMIVADTNPPKSSFFFGWF